MIMLKYITIIFILIGFISCDNDDLYIEESIFISDPEVSGLPIYSEMGYNTFGVRYERDFIIQDDKSYPLKIVAENNTTSFIFSGRNGYYEEFNFTLHIHDYKPADLEDLLNLNQTTIDLSSGSADIEIKENDISLDVEIISGEFEIVKARKLMVDEDEKGVILSGVFQFKVFIDGIPVAFSLGRYDTLIAYSNFFVLD